jgi:hypothetical protein
MKEETRQDLIDAGVEAAADILMDNEARAEIASGAGNCLEGCAGIVLIVALPAGAALAYAVM